MRSTDTIVVGGGQAGLAMSRCLTDRGIEHVVLERGRVAERWRSERWDSLRLLTPNWQSRLPEWSYRGPDPDGFLAKDELVAHLEAYGRSFAAPVETATRVREVRAEAAGFLVDTDRGSWRARSVVVATGHNDVPHVPGFARDLPADVVQVVPSRYRRPSDLPDAPVLVVGASATGLQLAEELRRSGRAVTLAVGRHTRLPRSYRGRDIQRWLDALGVWDERIEDVSDPQRSRHEPSLQLVGSSDHHSLDLGVLQDLGVRLVGRAVGIDGGLVVLGDDLGATIEAADVRLARLLRRIDEHIERAGLAAEVAPEEPLRGIAVPAAPSRLDVTREPIGAVVWATGFGRSYPWLRVPVLDRGGEIRHDGGITRVPGLYVLGLQFQRTRKSSLIDGVGADAAFLAERIAQLRGASRATAA